VQQGISATSIFEQDGLRITQDDEYRYLVTVDDAVLSTLSLQDTAKLCLPCMQAMMVALLFVAAPKRVLQLGLGAGDTVRFLRAAYPDSHITAVEYDANMVQLAQRYFSLPPADAHFTLMIDDAAHALSLQNGTFDLILLDIVMDMQQPEAYQQAQLFHDCARHMQAHTVLAINFIVSDTEVLAEFVAMLKQVFHSTIFCLPVAGYHNVILFVLNSCSQDIQLQALHTQAEELAQRFQFPLQQFVDDMKQLN